MDVLGIINKNSKVISIDKKKCKLKDIFVFCKGKIFNFNELCSKHNISAKTNEELILELYLKQSLKFLNELDGNFAIVIYDSKIDKLYLIKDKLGSFVIYYSVNKNNFLFSTSLKMLMDCNEFEKRIDNQALANFLGYGYIYEPFSIFHGTKKLEKGKYLILDNMKVKILQYFNLRDEYKNTKKIIKVSNMENDLSNLFYNSLAKLGNKDSQVGVLMSSGKDSTLLAKLAQNHFKTQINTYTLGFENERDETVKANKIAEYIGSNHHSIILKDKYVKSVIKKIPLIYDEPFADPSIIPSIYLFDEMDKENDFLITGDGVDTIFMSNDMFNIYDTIPRFKLFIRKIIGIIKQRRVYKDFSEMAQVNIISRFNYSDKLLSLNGKVFELENNDDKRRESCLGGLLYTVPDKYNYKSVMLSKYHGFKYFAPFYDIDILKRTFEVSTREFNKEGKKKYIFEKVLYNNIPKSFFEDYKKNGFGVPIIDWLKRFMLDDLKKISTEEFIKKQDLFKYEELMNLIRSFEEKPNYDKALVLWGYYNFQLWYKHNMI